MGWAPSRFSGSELYQAKIPVLGLPALRFPNCIWVVRWGTWADRENMGQEEERRDLRRDGLGPAIDFTL
jgi:hypothetical protein